MNELTVALILGLAVIGVIGFLLFRATTRGGGNAKFSVGSVFKAEISIPPQTEAEVRHAVAQAANHKRLKSPKAPSRPAKGWHLGRILWVDDNPDWSVYETIALETLGLFVTKTTSTNSAQVYLKEMAFDLVISDMGRDGEGPEAGLRLTRYIRQNHPSLPVIIYTADARRHLSSGMEAGAFSVVDTPWELVDEVSRARTPE